MFKKITLLFILGIAFGYVITIPESVPTYLSILLGIFIGLTLLSIEKELKNYGKV